MNDLAPARSNPLELLPFRSLENMKILPFALKIVRHKMFLKNHQKNIENLRKTLKKTMEQILYFEIPHPERSVKKKFEAKSL